jgi:hypothetical protein
MIDCADDLIGSRLEIVDEGSRVSLSAEW